MSHGEAASSVIGSPSRITSQTDQLRGLAERVDQLTATNVKHARQLGFFGPPEKTPGPSGLMPSPVITSLDDAIQNLARSIDNLDGSMNLFN